MTIVVSSRGPIDTALDSPESFVLVLVGPRDGAGGRIHDLLEEREDLREEPFRKWFLVVDPGVLGRDRATWLQGRDSGYVVLSGDPKRVTSQGPLELMLRADIRTPSILRILKAWSGRPLP